MTNDVIRDAGEEFATFSDNPQDLEEFLEYARENPGAVAHSVKYVLEAIEYCGTRTVIEEGEELERWCFFDDWFGDGEHAVLGNTKMLNDFVDELRRMASRDGENDQIMWFNGPTATGKSELKRCFINGLRGYSRTNAGKRYTLEWSIDSLSEGAQRMTYGDGMIDNRDWYRSPINVNPAAVLPEETKKRYLQSISLNQRYPVDIEADIDPFSEEAFDYLQQQYSDDSGEAFSKITSSDHLRVVRFPMDVGEGIGILHSEDDGSPKERLVGSWMPDMFDQFASRGRKNPQAFSYDGVLSQGNGGMTIIEDASEHNEVLQKMLNIPEEGMVKLDKKTSMDIDTLLVAISNPDLEEALNQYQERQHQDPFKALRRRLNKFNFHYLRSISLETQLIRRQLISDTNIWLEQGDDAMELARQPIWLYGCEFAPHTIESAALYDVLTRIESASINNISLLEKALIYERGYHLDENGEKIDSDEVEIEVPNDGKRGIPVTLTEDVLVDLAQENDVVLPNDVTSQIKEELYNSPVISEGEAAHYADLFIDVERYAVERAEEDVIESILDGEQPDEEDVRKYVDAVFEWENSDTDNDEGEEFDNYELRQFEMEYLGLFPDEYAEKAMPKQSVAQFRKEKIISPLNNYMWSNRGEDYGVDDELPLRECPVLDRLLDSVGWADVKRRYENFDSDQWRDPPSNSETEEVKEKAIDNLIEKYDYTEESAEKMSAWVIDERIQ